MKRKVIIVTAGEHSKKYVEGVDFTKQDSLFDGGGFELYKEDDLVARINKNAGYVESYEEMDSDEQKDLQPDEIRIITNKFDETFTFTEDPVMTTDVGLRLVIRNIKIVSNKELKRYDAE